jgi:hypothetical protein
VSRAVNMAKLMEKIAKQVNVDAAELAQKAEETRNLYSHDEAVMQRQAVINFFTTYVAPEEPRRQPNESQVKYAQRVSDYNNARNEWKFDTCLGCGERFVYAYHYRGVHHCSLECLDATLRKIGIKVTSGRDLKKRWGVHHPAVVPADALKTLEHLYGHDSASGDAEIQSSLPKNQSHSTLEHVPDTLDEQDNQSNTA